MSDVPFWQSKTLDEMSDAEWESLCDGCGQCCLHKLMDEDTDEIYFTNVACRQLNIKTCQCRNYERRFEFEPDCIKLIWWFRKRGSSDRPWRCWKHYAKSKAAFWSIARWDYRAVRWWWRHGCYVTDTVKPLMKRLAIFEPDARRLC